MLLTTSQDTSGDGVLSEAEMLAMFEALSFPRDEAETLLKDADSNRDGKVQVHEFISWFLGVAAARD